MNPWGQGRTGGARAGLWRAGAWARGFRFAVWGVMGCVGLLGGVAPAPAAVRYVNAAVGGGSGNGSNWANAHTNVIAALAAAVAGDDLWVAQGTYSASATVQLKDGVGVYGGFTSTTAVFAARDWLVYPVLLNGSGVRRVLIGTNNTVLDGVVVTNGNAAASGGGLLISGVGMTVRNCLFANNLASGGTSYGGAIAQLGAGSASIVSNCVFRENSAAYGGAIHWGAGSTTLRGCRFIGNSAQGGGALYPLALSGAIEDTVFVGNAATSAGGGAVYSGSRANCVAAFRRCVFAGNTAGGGSGYGGAFIGGDAYAIEQCIFSANRTASWAGALFGADNATVVRRSVLAGNEAPNGAGASYYQGAGAPAPSYENCLFAGNATPGLGGAMYAYSGSRFDLHHSTFVGNRAGSYGGALYHNGGSGLWAVTNCVFWTNSAGTAGAQIYANTPGLVAVNYSAVQGGWGGVGVANLSADPQFAGGPTGVWSTVGSYDAAAGQTALTAAGAGWAGNAYRGLTVNPDAVQDLQFVIASNGTETLYVWGNALTNRIGAAVATAGDAFLIYNTRPTILSPVIDVGANVGVTVDLAGNARPLNEGYDMGAYETAVPTLAYTLLTSPGGLAVQSDATTAAAPRAMTWKTNSVHTIAVASPQSGGAGTQFVFSAWSDGGAQSHEVTAHVDGTMLMAAFSTQMLWTTAVEPVASAGAVTPASGTWYDRGTGIPVQAIAANGWVFTNWAGTVSGTNAALVVTMDQARHGLAQFGPTGTVVRVVASPFGRTIDVDGTAWTTNMFSWQPGEVHTLSVVATQGVGSTRYVFTQWENGSTDTQRVFTTGTAATNLVAQFKTQHALTWTVLPDPALGAVEPATGSYFDAGSTVSLTALAQAGVPFARWTGAAAGTSTNTTVLMNAPKQVNAYFQYGPAPRVIYVDDTATGNNSGANWFDARIDLAQALAQATSGDEIWVARGTYIGGGPFPMKVGVNMVGGFAGWEGRVTERHWSANATILDGQGARRVITATNNAALDGFIITNGYSTAHGGGMAIYSVTATIRNCLFANNNAATTYGGALVLSGAGSLAVVSNCVFRDNTAAWGGALYVVSGGVEMRDSAFERNTTTGGGGVGYVTALTGLVENCIFRGNVAASGGAFNSGSRLNCTATFRDCVFAANTGTTSGGAFSGNDGYTFESCVFSGNRAGQYGGSYYGIDCGSVFRRCIFAAGECNTTHGGGAMYSQSTAATPTFENCLFAGNASAGPGGALQANAAAGYTLRHCTFAGNRATTSGGALACGNGTIQIVDSVLWGNSAGVTNGEIHEATPGSASVLYSDVRGGRSGAGNIDADPLFAGGPASTWTAGPAYDPAAGQTAFTDAANLWADSLLVGRLLNPNTNQTLQFVVASNRAGIVYVWGNATTNYPGTLTTNALGSAYRLHSLQPLSGSPVIDAGVDFGVAEDIRGAVRPQPVAGAFDMGAYEGAYTQTVAFTAAATVIGEPAGAVVLHVVLDSLLQVGEGRVEVAVTGGTAVAGVDYTFAATSLVFNAATGAYALPVTILDNGAADPMRTIVLGLFSPTNLLIGAVSMHTITILDDDAPVSVSFDAAASSGLENISPARLGVSLNRPHGLPARVRYALAGGSATPDVDVALLPGVLEFAVGETNKSVEVSVMDNPEPEIAESVEVLLSAPVNASMGANPLHTFTILDDDFMYVDHAAGGANNGTSWGDAYTNLATAINRADRLDVIWVAEGTYRPAQAGESTTNRFNIRAAIQLYGGFRSGMGDLIQRDPYRNVTILSGDLSGDDTAGFGNRADNVANVVHVSGAYGGQLVIDGFTVRGGYGVNSGAGLYLDKAGPFLVTRCTFTDNDITASGLGAGMWCDLGATGTVRNCLFFGNYSGYRAAGFGMDGYLPPYAQIALVNCTVSANTAQGEGDGVYARADDVPVFSIRNCILWLNGALKAEPQNLRERGNTTVTVSYSDYDRVLSSGDGITDLGGQLTTDPLFADPAQGDYHLKSQAGRWTQNGLVFDAVTSPCIDAGDPADPCEDEPQGDPCRIDMGAYGGSIQAAGAVGASPSTGFIIMVK
jgi:predicted outer membrane repeat protein